MRELFQLDQKKFQEFKAIVSIPVFQEAISIIRNEGKVVTPRPIAGVSYAEMVAVEGSRIEGWHQALDNLVSLANRSPDFAPKDPLGHEAAKQALMAQGLYTEEEINKITQ